MTDGVPGRPRSEQRLSGQSKQGGGQKVKWPRYGVGAKQSWVRILLPLTGCRQQTYPHSADVETKRG